eukprot:CAMPEP_0114692620 /NCGR_PEP_ID=MMETSP0191-20121206/68162_1 /TAXON_ID=126664 /ORGANISM="Sorites sp." /LENGTH=39 /DNA_ID= /DNA_START= /DNA_END= /DNA_ORIENTATION=
MATVTEAMSNAWDMAPFPMPHQLGDTDLSITGSQQRRHP